MAQLPNEPAHRDAFIAFVEAACVPMDRDHTSGTLEWADAILAAHPRLAGDNIFAAAILGDEGEVRRFLELDIGSATRMGGPRSWDPLTYLCFSRYLRLDRARAGFVRTAEALLDAGSSANTGFYAYDHEPPEFESVLYGAAGVAHNAELARLLLERGADANDDEVVYHTPETHDNGALKALLETDTLTGDSLATMLLRKHDWHDYDGVRLLLAHGAEANRLTRWGYSALHQALRRDNDIAIVDLLLKHGADPEVLGHGRSGAAMAARQGRGDVLDLFDRRGITLGLQGVDQVLAACSRDDAATVQSLVHRQPEVVPEILAMGGTVLGKFAGVGNTRGVRHLLDLGVDVAAVDEDGDGYWGIARHSTALHVAAWRARHDTVRLLIERGAPINLKDGNGRTALDLAVRACVDSYWTARRSPESVAALLAAGASIATVDLPSRYDEVDDLLRQYGQY